MRPTGRLPSERVRDCGAIALLLSLILVPTRLAGAGDPLPAPAKVVLKGGHVFTGAVVRTVVMESRPFSVVQTDFGEILVPQGEVAKAVPAVKASDTFLADQVRIVRVSGQVERRAPGEQGWSLLQPMESSTTDRTPPRIHVGDAVRTGADGHLDVMLHRDAWVRLEPDTEVEFSRAAAKGSLALLRGTTIHDVTGRPRGQTFRVTTPSTTLGVRGTRFAVFAEEKRQGVAVLHGVVRVGTASDITEGQEGSWTDPATVTVSPLSEARRRLIDTHIHRLPIDEMAYVPGGRYPVGRNRATWSLSESFEWSLSGGPAPLVFAAEGLIELRAFLIDQREVTRGEVAAFTGSSEHALPGIPDEPERSREPAFEVTYSQAEAFAQWAGKSLPTASQWHVAGRGPRGGRFPWGSAVTDAHRKLVIGTWNKAVTAGWIPPPSLPAVDAPTVDVSQFGVRALVSSVPEWARTGIERESLWSLLLEDAKAQFGGRPTLGPVCGVASSLLGISPSGSKVNGFRCVIELGGR